MVILLRIRQAVAIVVAVAGMVLRFGVQRTAGLLVLLYRSSDDGVANVRNELLRDEKLRDEEVIPAGSPVYRDSTGKWHRCRS